jgi:hypothetical protein
MYCKTAVAKILKRFENFSFLLISTLLKILPQMGQFASKFPQHLFVESADIRPGSVKKALTAVKDPDPKDPYVFGPPGSFYHQEK